MPPLHHHVHTLALVEETRDPLLSAYLNLAAGRVAALRVLRGRVEILARDLSRRERAALVEARHRAEELLLTLPTEARAAAIFVRAGQRPFEHGIPLHGEVEERVAVDTIPLLTPLMERKDSYRRFLIVVSAPEAARILEVLVGSTTSSLWASRPDLVARVAREWSAERYRRRREAGEDFAVEKVRVLEELARRGGDTSILLLGEPELAARVAAALPPHLRALVLDSRAVGWSGLAGAAYDELQPSLRRALAQAVQDTVAPEDPLDVLHRHLRSDGLAAVGPQAVVEALAAGLVDTLFLAPRWNEPGRRCPSCGAVDTRGALPGCPVCGALETDSVELREHLARLAAGSGARLQVLPREDALHELGIAALLRMRRPVREPAAAGTKASG